MVSAKKIALLLIAACALACAALLFFFPPAASAETLEVSVGSAEEWNELALKVADGENFFGVTVTLTDDISGELLPLGSKTAPFCGVLDGGGHILFTSMSGEDYLAPVGYLAGGKVMRLGVHGDMRGEQAVGGVVGFNDHGTIEKCYHFGSVSADNYAGGIAGENRGSVIDCYNIGSVSTQGEDRFAGGITATNDYDARVQDCYAVSRVESTGRGGILGYAGRGSVLNCFYLDEGCDRGYSQAGNAVLDINALSKESLMKTAPSSSFALFEGGGEDWGAYPRLSALSSPLNAYVDWDDHLLTDDLLVLDDGGERTIAARRAQQLPALEKRGYSFLGWFSESEGGEKVEQVEGSGDLCLYARFTPVVYKITFDLGGGAFKEGFSPVLEYTVLDEVTLPGEEDVLLSGKVFGGWLNEDGEEISSIPLGSVGDIRLTARYSSAAAAAISGFGSRYFWIILDAALALVLLAEAALLTRAAKKRRQAVFAFAPFSSAALFYPLGFYIACAELAAILLMPLLLLRVKRVRARAAAASEMPREQFLAAPFLPPLLMPGEPIAQIDEIDSRLRYRNSYTARLAMSSERAKELYRGFKGYALSYERVRSRISWGGETFFAGKSPLARLNVTGNTLKIYFPLDPSEVGQRYRAQDKRGVKKYALTPVMVKVRSDRALRRARELLDLAAKKLMLQRGAATERVLDNEELLRREASRRELIDKGFIKSDISFKEKDA